MGEGAITSLLKNRPILWKMTVRDFKSKYAGSVMGLFWTVINPLLLLAVFSFVGIAIVKVKFGGRPGVDALYIFCGILPWLAFQDAVARSSSVVIENKNLVTRARFPLSVLPVYPVLSSTLSQLIGMAVLAGVSAAWIGGLGPSVLSLVLLFALQVAFTAGVCMLLASLSVHLRDVAHVVPVLLLVWMFGTPIFYKAEALPARLVWLVELNPLAALIACYRSVLLEAAWPEARQLLILAAWTIVLLPLGAAAYKRMSKGFADRL